MALTILDGGPFDSVKLYVGPERELIADTSNWDLLLQDGTTPGGHRFMNMANADERYQARSTELDGLIDFEPQQKGYLVRLGPADYRIRTFEWNADNFLVTYPDGYNGNTKLELASEIKSNHTFSGEVTFSQSIIASGGVTGNVVGDVTGNLTGNVTGDVTGNLTGDANGNHTGTFTGSVDVRGETLLLDPGQIHLASLNSDVTDYIQAKGVPVGVILMWGGAVIDIPTPLWALCDGQNGTPDLRDRFIVGAGGDYDPDDNGGADSVTPTITVASGGAHVHTGGIAPHALTVDEIPSHRHLNGVVDKNDNLYNHGGAAAVPTLGDSIDGNSSSGTREGYTTYTGGGLGHSHDFSMDSSGAHSHSGTSSTLDNRPKYYALCYIQKVA